MNYDLLDYGEKLGSDRVAFLDAFKRSCRRTILQMLKTSQSGHPGGSLSNLDFLAVLYAFRLTNTNEKIIVSNGHISPGVYSVLAEVGAVDKDEVINTFRQVNSIFEGHVTRHIPGITFGTGPLGAGISVAAGFALAEKKKGSKQTVFATLGDGEMQEGQVHEMALHAAKEKLDNFVVFVDYNRVQLTDSLEATLPIHVTKFFTSKDWHVIEIDGHDDEAIWEALSKADQVKDKPIAIIGETIMGKGISIMEPDGVNLKPTWHGKAPKPEVIDEELEKIVVTEEEQKMLEQFRTSRNFQPTEPIFIPNLEKMTVDPGEPVVYGTDELKDCRGAYGKALLDLAKANKEILASTADLGGSVMTKFVKAERPDQFVEFGIAEQNMVSVCGGLSLNGFVPFCSTFGAFMSSRAKDQARVNDINRTNVKMVSTHCGLSVGEDGPTHQAIDDMGSFLGMFNTMICEPADPNHCDRIIRYVGTHYGNFYVRMGRAKLATLTTEDGDIFFDKDYEYYYGRTDVLRKGNAVTIVATGAAVHEALQARAMTGIDAEIVIVSSVKKFDETLENSLRKTGKVITVEDHNSLSGLASQVTLFAAELGIGLDFFRAIAVEEYQLSGKPAELYHEAGIDAEAVAKVLKEI